MPRREFYSMNDGRFSFHTAIYPTKFIIFRAREDNEPSERAAQKDITNYNELRPATDFEVGYWLYTHPGFSVNWERR